MSNILIIGGAGYIGSHVAKLLKTQGDTPIVLDDFSTGHREAVKFGPLFEGSYGDGAFLDKVFRSHKISTVMHFGAKAVVSESVANPYLYYSENVAGTIALLGAMVRNNVKRIVFSSTCATFGVPEEMPIHEKLNQKPINPYGHSKLFVEQILRDMAKSDGIQSAVLRYFNAAGCDPDGELGEDHEPETHLIPRALQVATGREKKLTVYGNDYNTKDGSCVRDYVHVNDLGQAHIKAMQLMSKPESIDFNLGSENGYSVFEVVESIERITGKKVPIEIGPRRPGDPPVLIAKSTKAHKELGWKPQFGLDQIVETAFHWMQKKK